MMDDAAIEVLVEQRVQQELVDRSAAAGSGKKPKTPAKANANMHPPKATDEPGLQGL
jgi:hypothetical protein